MDVCLVCGESEPMEGKDVCSKCGSDIKTLGPEAGTLMSDEPEYPDFNDERERFEEGYRGDGL